MVDCAKSGGCRHWSGGQLHARPALGTPLQLPSQRHFTSTKPSLRVLQEQRDHDNNRHLGNINIKPYSNRVCSWVCPLGTPDDPHCWEARVARRLQVARCPYCIGCRTSKVDRAASKS
ncbi:hypothetical protein WJX79_006067 [Trebouxia sp. C0005]